MNNKNYKHARPTFSFANEYMKPPVMLTTMNSPICTVMSLANSKYPRNAVGICRGLIRHRQDKTGSTTRSDRVMERLRLACAASGHFS